MPVTAVVSLDGFVQTPKAPASGPKAPFVRIAGVPLLTRQILTLQKQGIEKIWLVPGSHERNVQALFSADPRLQAAPVEMVPGQGPEAIEKALQAVGKVEGTDRILLAGGDVFFGPGIVRHAANGVPENAPARLRQGVDLFFATKSALGGSGSPLAVLEKAPPLKEGERPDSKDAYLHQIRTAADTHAAKRSIFANVTKPTSGWVSRNINSKLSIPLSKLVSEFPVSPNMLTLFATLVGLCAAPLLALGDQWGVFWGGLCFQLASALDRCDGEIARSKFEASERGEWIDTIGDNITYLFFLIGLTAGTYRRTGDELILYVGGGLLLMAVGVLGVMYRYLLNNTSSGSLVAVYKDMEAKFEGKEKPLAYRFLDKIRFMGKRDFYSFLVFVLCALNLLQVVFWGAVVTVSCILVYVLSGKSKLSGNAVSP